MRARERGYSLRRGGEGGKVMLFLKDEESLVIVYDDDERWSRGCFLKAMGRVKEKLLFHYM